MQVFVVLSSRDLKYLNLNINLYNTLDLTLINDNISVIYGITNLIKGFGRANIMLPNGAKLHINDALYFRNFIMNLLNFKDIHINGYHIQIMNEYNTKCLNITSINYDKKL